jgi:hypothetical protein
MHKFQILYAGCLGIALMRAANCNAAFFRLVIALTPVLFSSRSLAISS